MSFTITPDILAIGTAAFDSLINQLGKQCRLYFPVAYTPCSNCGPSPVGNIPVTVYVTGGPAYFPTGSLCPLCGGNGQIQTEKYQDITLLLNWTPKEFDKQWQSYLNRLPEGSIQAKGFISDMATVSQCNYMQADIALAAYANYRFKLTAEPVSTGNIIKHRYFTSLWERIPA